MNIDYVVILRADGGMAKRAATSQLTADNWQEEEDNDEAEEVLSISYVCSIKQCDCYRLVVLLERARQR